MQDSHRPDEWLFYRLCNNSLAKDVGGGKNLVRARFQNINFLGTLCYHAHNLHYRLIRRSFPEVHSTLSDDFL